MWTLVIYGSFSHIETSLGLMTPALRKRTTMNDSEILVDWIMKTAGKNIKKGMVCGCIGLQVVKGWHAAAVWWWVIEIRL